MITSNRSGGHPQTTVPLREAAANASHPDPEFVDVPGLYRQFGIRRSLAYQLLREGLIQGVSLRRRGQTRGKRLFVVDSVRAYLRGEMLLQVQAPCNGRRRGANAGPRTRRKAR